MNDVEELTVERPDSSPTHPGVVLRTTVLPALHLNVMAAAAELRISRQTLHRILSGETSITPPMAVRLGKFCGNGPSLWPSMQQAHDLWKAEQELELEQIPSHADTAA